MDGFVALVPGEQLVERAMRYFSETAGGEDAELRVVATFPKSDGSPPLEWRFDLSAESKAEPILEVSLWHYGPPQRSYGEPTPVDYQFAGQHPSDVALWREHSGQFDLVGLERAAFAVFDACGVSATASST